MMANYHRFFIELKYCGTAYHGWQAQPNGLTVQEIIDRALSTIFRQKIQTLGCGRTDAGVHATQFFAHFDLHEETAAPNEQVLRSLNALLPHDVAAIRFIAVPPDAHARFDALLRSYEYHIHFLKDPFKYQRSYLCTHLLDVEAMNEAAALLLAYQDFACFRKSNTQVLTTHCFLKRAQWVEQVEGLIFHISANRFLRNMVRAIVGTLLDVGMHKLKPQDLCAILESKNRSLAGTSVPARGLYLTEVRYNYL